MSTTSKGGRTDAQSGASALAKELWQIPSTQRHAFGITDDAIRIWDAGISCIRILIDDSDPRSWLDRLDEFVRERFGDIEDFDEANVERFAAEAQRLIGADIPEWAQDIKKEGFQRFARRAVGEAAYHRLVAALQTDAAVLTVALRRATRGLMPYAVALDDLYSVLPERERMPLPMPPSDVSSDVSSTMLSLMWVLDTSLEKLVEFSAPIVAEESSPPELTLLTKNDLLKLAVELRRTVSGRSRQKVTELSSSLGRKVQGARDALQYSADSVAQAANSLIELIDRLLRAAFTDAEVLSWIEQNYPEAKDLTWIDRGLAKPTKRGQILCFVHAGFPVDKPSVIHQLAATALATARTQLQKLKHADQGTEEELEEVQQLLAAVEGFLHLAIGVAWAAASDERVESLRLNLDARR
ncbi:hypothetical protein ODJ79_05685 [Actinoplanes sp. KI2]|uniref:hypothetical protein n=1 Tax=Actinoplanes sp. KI2 TaxID=2983315 RepID=UPI0021D56EB7|nr:hypothetical protein [Actinoplanes sp. KI2]MCU7723199.1 hypothetical protein [Actinoplanes sp. KI2]